MTDAPTIYVFVRTDLPLADQMVQVGHVCATAASTFPVPDRCRLVLFGVDNVDALESAIRRCQQHGIRAVTFVESDPVDGESSPMGLTAACTEPIDRCARRPLRRYRLWTAPR